MRIVRFLDASQQEHFGVLQADGTALRLTAAPWQDYTVTPQKLSIAKLLAPVIPPAIMCIGLNYRKHAEETGAKIPSHPVLFMKNPAAIQNPGDPIVLPRKLASTKVDYECELAIVIGQRCKNVARKDALNYVLGYTCANDVSARDWQKDFGGTQWCRGKTFDTFCPIGPAIVTPDEVGDPNQLHLSTDVSGERLQSSSTQDMIFDVPTLIEFLSGSTTLLPGTVILTGTPEGVGMGRTPNRYLKAGDLVTITIERIGSLTNPVIEET